MPLSTAFRTGAGPGKHWLQGFRVPYRVGRRDVPEDEGACQKDSGLQGLSRQTRDSLSDHTVMGLTDPAQMN